MIGNPTDKLFKVTPDSSAVDIEVVRKNDHDNIVILSKFLTSKYDAGDSKATFYSYSSCLTRLQDTLKNNGLNFFPPSFYSEEKQQAWMEEIADIMQRCDVDRRTLSIIRSFYTSTTIFSKSPFAYIEDKRVAKNRKQVVISVDGLESIIMNRNFANVYDLRDIILLLTFLGTNLKVNELIKYRTNNIVDYGLRKDDLMTVLHPTTKRCIENFISKYYSSDDLKIKNLPIFPSFSPKGIGSHEPLTKRGCFGIFEGMTGTTTPYIPIVEFNEYLDTLKN